MYNLAALEAAVWRVGYATLLVETYVLPRAAADELRRAGADVVIVRHEQEPGPDGRVYLYLEELPPYTDWPARPYVNPLNPARALMHTPRPATALPVDQRWNGVPRRAQFGQRTLPVLDVRELNGAKWLCVNISTTDRPMYHWVRHERAVGQ